MELCFLATIFTTDKLLYNLLLTAVLSWPRVFLNGVGAQIILVLKA